MRDALNWLLGGLAVYAADREQYVITICLVLAYFAINKFLLKNK